MAVEVKVRHDLEDLERRLGIYGTQLMLAATRAINRTMPTVRQHSVERMRALYPGLRVGALRNQIKLAMATAKDPRGAVTYSEKRFRLFGNWVRRQGKRGVRAGRLPYRIETLDGQPVSQSQLRHAFIQRPRFGAGAVNVWIRVGEARYPITALLGPSLSSALVERNLKASAVAVGHERFKRALEQEARYRLSKKGVATFGG